MKTKILCFALIINTFAFAQSKFTLGFGISEQFLSKDLGVNYEGSVGYNVTSDLSINLAVANAKMKNKDLDINYTIDKYSIIMGYDFAKSERTKLESLFGFSYINFDEKLLLDDNKDLGVDIGIQTTFGLKNRLNYGLRLTSTYSSISPGALFNAGIFFKYKL